MRRTILLNFIISVAAATVVPQLSFEELVAKSDQIVTGKVVNSTMSWGSEHKYIWTRYEIAVDDAIKGVRESTIVVSEPGGDLGGQVMRIAGSLAYIPGERVTLFLRRYPSGDTRTVGWAQGKFTVDTNQRVHPAGLGLLARFEGMNLGEFRRRILLASRAGTLR